MVLWKNKRVLLRDNFRYAIIINKIPSGKWLVSYFNHANMLKYRIISEDDIIEEEEYKIIQNRNNKINSILDD